MKVRTIRLWAFLSLATVTILLVLANFFHATISESQVAVYAHLATLAFATLATAYFLPRAIGTLFGAGRRPPR